MRQTAYPLEDIRQFFMYRAWFHGPGRLLSGAEYQNLKTRTLRWSPQRAKLMRAFMLGWMLRSNITKKQFAPATAKVLQELKWTNT